jgi:cell division septation protein DedD
MDEGIKRKLVGAGVLVTIALVILPNLASRTRNAEYLAESVAVEANVPSMNMPLPKALSIEVSADISPSIDAGKLVVMEDIQVNAEVLPLTGFEIPVTTRAGQAVVWLIQVGSFAKASNALTLRDELRAAGYKAYEKLSLDGKYTRIFVGPSSQKSLLRKKLTDIETQFKLKAEIVLFKG